MLCLKVSSGFVFSKHGLDTIYFMYLAQYISCSYTVLSRYCVNIPQKLHEIYCIWPRVYYFSST